MRKLVSEVNIKHKEHLRGSMEINNSSISLKKYSNFQFFLKWQNNVQLLRESIPFN